MNLRPRSTISVLLALSGLVTVGLLSSLTPSQAKPTSNQPTQFTVTPTATPFKLITESKPFQPTGLKKNEEPSSDRGVICKPGQPPKDCDDRIPVTSRGYPWSAIGRVIIARADGKFSGCTGVLIQADIVLTNAHCIVDSKDSTLAKWIEFRPNLINGKVRQEKDIAEVVDVHYGTDFKTGRIAPNPNDWGLLKLNKPLGKTYGYLGWKVLPPSVMMKKRDKFTMVGYSGDFPNPEKEEYRKMGLTAGKGETAGAHIQCSILGELKDDKAVLVHDCDTTGGSSGGPILAVIDGEYYVIALNSAELTEQDEKGTVVRGIENYAVKMNRLEEWLKKKP